LVTLPGRAPFQVLVAAEKARSARGPVFLSLPLDVAVTQSAGARLARRAVVRDEIDRRSLEQAVTALRTAERPLVLVGSGARGAARSLRALVGRLNLPVITSPRAKGVVAEGAPGN